MTDLTPNMYADIARQGFFTKLLEHESFLESYEHFLRGEVLTIQRSDDKLHVQEVWIRRYPPKMNDYGINEIMSFLKPLCESKIMAMTDFEDRHVNELGYTNIQSYTELLVENYKVFEIPSISVLDTILVTGINIIMAQLRRSFKGTTLTQLTTNMNVTESRNIVPEAQDSRNLFQKLPIFGKKKGLQFDL